MKQICFFLLGMFCCFMSAGAVDLKQCRVVQVENEVALVKKVANVFAEDVERVTGVRPTVSTCLNPDARLAFEFYAHEPMVVIATVEGLEELGLTKDVNVEDIRGRWECYKIVTKGKRVYVVGSDARGTAYGAFHVSEKIGVSPWYWFADVPVQKKTSLDYKENYTSKEPTVKYRGIFINDEDWGLKTWAAENFEKELGDIGPKTYDKVCELLLRLKANMLAPAMHTCTGAFYSHPESQVKAAEWGIMITTSHCEPLLFNNAAPSEWDKERDGEWNYLTNKETIWKKLDDRIR